MADVQQVENAVAQHDFLALIAQGAENRGQIEEFLDLG